VVNAATINPLLLTLYNNHLKHFTGISFKQILFRLYTPAFPFNVFLNHFWHDGMCFENIDADPILDPFKNKIV